MYAASIKGSNHREFKKNTGVILNKNLLCMNFDTIVDCSLPFYLTFTGMSEDSIQAFRNAVISRYGKQVLNDSFAIELIEYEALN